MKTVLSNIVEHFNRKYTWENSQHDEPKLLEKKKVKKLLDKVLDEISITKISHLKQKIKIPTCFQAYHMLDSALGTDFYFTVKQWGKETCTILPYW